VVAYQQDLVAAHTEAAVGEPAHLVGAERDGSGKAAHHDEVIA